MYCFNCRKQVETEIRNISETYAVRGEDITIDSCVRFCKVCGDEMFDETLDGKNLKSAYDKYRSSHNLISTQEIVMIRKKYGITQVSFSRILGLEDRRIRSLEFGSIPSHYENNLILLMRDPRNFSTLLERGKSSIPEEEYIVVKEIVTTSQP